MADQIRKKIHEITSNKFISSTWCIIRIWHYDLVTLQEYSSTEIHNVVFLLQGWAFGMETTIVCSIYGNESVTKRTQTKIEFTIYSLKRHTSDWIILIYIPKLYEIADRISIVYIPFKYKLSRSNRRYSALYTGMGVVANVLQLKRI